MLDELDLGFDEPDRRRSRHRRARRGGRPRGGDRRGSRRGRSLLALALTLVILGTLGGGAWYGFSKVRGFFVAPDYNSGGTGDVVIEIKAGEFASDIAATLLANDVVKSEKAFVDAAKAEPRSKDIQPGKYKLRHQMRAAQALQMLLERDTAGRLVHKLSFLVPIPEGLITRQIYAKLSEATEIPVAEFEKAAKDPVALGVPEFWFKRSDGKEPVTSIEGFLFPATYEFDPGVSAEQILRTMVAKFLEEAERLRFVEIAEQKSLTPFEALVTASLVQAEGIPDDMAKVARVVYNRLGDTLGPMPLQFDSTTNYWLSLRGQARKPSQHLTQAELDDPKNPYNTSTKLGLPPGPIGSPGTVALEAAIDPAKGDWLFFVAIDKEGRSAFAATDAEHEQNKAIARKNGVL